MVLSVEERTPAQRLFYNPVASTIELQGTKYFGFLTIEDGNEWLSRNFGKKLPLLAMQ
jgi:hypothetical protein